MWDILLLAERHDLQGLTDILKRHNPDIVVGGVSTREELIVETDRRPTGMRLICFCTGVIVPGAVLQAFDGPSYNFHPGPPGFPGVYPAVFAIYNDAERFGATAHEVTETVDDGAIVGVDLVDMPNGIDRLNLEALSRQLVTRLFVKLMPQLIENRDPLIAIDQQWSGRSWTRKDFESLCRLPADVTPEEFERRFRALGEGPEHALWFERFGRRFSLDPVDGDGHVYKGGQAFGAKADEA